jgi:serine/threonine-protein kinase
VLWETLAQRHLFKRETEFLTFQAITSDPIPDICEVRPDVPPLLGDTISRALSRDREHRFATARALGEALAQAVGPLGGPAGAATISDEIERAFADHMHEQRRLLDMARAGDTFDLERSNPLAAGTKLSTTPVSNIRGKLEAAQAEVAQYVKAQQAIRSLEGDDPSASGFTPPPEGQGLYLRPSRQRQRVSEPMTTVDPDPGSGVIIPPAQHLPVPKPVIIHHSSRLPWLVALVAVLVAGGVAVMFLTKHEPPPAAVEPPPQPQPVVMNTTPPPVSDAAVVARVEVDAAVAVVAPPPSPPPPPKKREPKVAQREPAVPSGPPGFITIDSAPVYAVIWIDGKKVGETPLVHISVPAGKHSVRAVSPQGTTRNLTITIESGKTAPVRKIEW